MLIKYLWAWDVATHGDIHSIPFGRDLPVDGKQKYEFLKTVFLMACLLYIFSAIKALQSYRLVVGTIWGMIFDKYCRFFTEFNGFRGMLWDGFITDVMRQTDGNTPYGMVQRGYAYEHGIVGVEKNLCQAISWYKKAAEVGEHFAMLKLADAYMSGKFIEKNERIALTIYREVAEKMVCSETGYA